MSILSTIPVFNLKKEWFEKIKSGEKTHEYREVKPYWTKRLESILFWLKEKPHYTYFGVIKCGYPERSEKDKHLLIQILSIKIVNGINTDLKIDKPVYDIEFELIKEKNK